MVHDSNHFIEPHDLGGQGFGQSLVGRSCVPHGTEITRGIQLVAELVWRVQEGFTRQPGVLA